MKAGRVTNLREIVSKNRSGLSVDEEYPLGDAGMPTTDGRLDNSTASND